MVKVTLYGVVKTETSGHRCWVGYTAEETVIEGLTVSPVDMLDPEDGSTDRWVLACPVSVPLLDAEDLEGLQNGELRRATLAKLSDVELASIGVTRGE